MMPEHSPARSSSDAASRVTAIETSYKGYRFRSRLEARWAVFLDHLKLEWKYEPQGYMVEGQPYLPDFWVDGLGWVEVKGEIDRAGLLKLGLAARPDGLPMSPDGVQPKEIGSRMGPGWSWLDVARPTIPRLVLLGDIPDPNHGHTHVQFALSNGRHVVFRPFFFTPAGPLVRPYGEWSAIGADPWPGMPHGVSTGSLTLERSVSEAYRAARSARFEHGESGAV